MKKIALTLGVVLLLIFILLTVLRKDRTAPTTTQPDRDAISAEQKSKITSFWSAYEKAESLRISGDTRGAVKYYRKALEINPAHENSLYYLGNMLSELGRHDEAVSTFKRLISVNPRSARAHKRIGHVLSTPCPGAPLDLEAARVHFNEALQLNIEESNPHFCIGRVLTQMGKFEEGRKYLLNAARMNPTYVEAFQLLAYICLLEGRFSEAATYYSSALEAGGANVKPDVAPGEGDTKESLKAKGPTSRKNIASLFGLAVASTAAGGYAQAVPTEYRVELPVHGQYLVKAAPMWGENKTANGNAAAWLDFDNDGDDDLALVGPHAPLTLWKNEGNLRFTEVTAEAGLDKAGKRCNVLAVDFDADGDEDLYLLRGDWFDLKQGFLFKNENGRFLDVTEQVGCSEARPMSQAAFADFNQGGYPDLLGVGLDEHERGEVSIYSGSTHGFRLLWRESLRGEGLPVDCVIGDYNNDSFPDIFILRWPAGCLLLRNLDGKNFKDVTKESGIDVDFASLSALFLDYNNDGKLDLFMSALAPYEDVLRSVLGLEPGADKGRPVLFTNKGGGVFERAASEKAFARCFGTLDAVAIDMNRDGFVDIYLSNGGLEPGRFEPDALLTNQGGKFFTCGYSVYEPPKSLSAAVGDIDSEGKLGLFVARGGFVPGEKKEGALYVTRRK